VFLVTWSCLETSWLDSSTLDKCSATSFSLHASDSATVNLRQHRSSIESLQHDLLQGCILTPYCQYRPPTTGYSKPYLMPLAWGSHASARVLLLLVQLGYDPFLPSAVPNETPSRATQAVWALVFRSSPFLFIPPSIPHLLNKYQIRDLEGSFLNKSSFQHH
jgi:hypothetical protein